MSNKLRIDHSWRWEKEVWRLRLYSILNSSVFLKNLELRTVVVCVCVCVLIRSAMYKCNKHKTFHQLHFTWLKIISNLRGNCTAPIMMLETPRAKTAECLWVLTCWYNSFLAGRKVNTPTRRYVHINCIYIHISSAHTQGGVQKSTCTQHYGRCWSIHTRTHTIAGQTDSRKEHTFTHTDRHIHVKSQIRSQTHIYLDTHTVSQT